MSASQEKKTRKQLREEGLDPRQIAEQKAERKARHGKRVRIIVGVVIVVLIIAVFAINSNLLYNNFAAVTIGDVEYTASEFSFFYNSAYYNFANSNASIINYIIDTSKPLSSQAYDEEMSWADYFKEAALTSMRSMTMRWSEAQKDGFVLDEEQQAELDKELAAVETAHTGSDYSDANTYFSTAYGKGLNVERVKKLVERSYIAQAYAEHVNDSFTYTNAELSQNYKENKDDYDVYNYLSCYISGAADEENDIDQETAMANAKELADSILSDEDLPPENTAGSDTDAEDGGDREEDTGDAKEETPEAAAFRERVKALAEKDPTDESNHGSALSETYADWLKDSSRKSGDKTVIESESGYYVLFFLSREDNDYDSVNVRHILVKAAAGDDGTYSDEAKKAAKDKAEELLKEWKDGVATEESFAELANANSEDTGSNTNGGLYENVGKGSMVEEFNDWIFDESRKPGDTGIVFNESSSYCGYHVMYFSGVGDNYRDVLAENALRSEDFTAWETGMLEKYTASKGFTAVFVK